MSIAARGDDEITVTLHRSVLPTTVSTAKCNVRLDQVRCTGVHPLSQASKPARVNPIKLEYDTGQPLTD